MYGLSFYFSADGPFLGMAESQHTMSESNAYVIKYPQMPVPNDVTRDAICSKLLPNVPNCSKL